MMTTTSTIRRRRLDRSGDIYFSAQKYLSELSEMKTSLGNLNMLWHLLYLSSFLSSYLLPLPISHFLSLSLPLSISLSLKHIHSMLQFFYLTCSLSHSIYIYHSLSLSLSFSLSLSLYIYHYKKNVQRVVVAVVVVKW